jgi:RimJ/RimL family protein N-acetyltransferase
VIEIAGRRVLLRAFRQDEFEAVYEAHVASDSIVGTVDRERLRRRVDRSGEWVDGRIDLAVESGGALVGSADVRSGRMILPRGVCEFGIELWAARRGAGIGTDAVTALTGWLHGNGFPRVQAGTSVTNAAMRRVLEKCGYAHEGTMRAFMPEGDGRGDYALYAHVALP